MEKISHFLKNLRLNHVLLFCLLVEFIVFIGLAFPTPNLDGFKQAIGLNVAADYLDQSLANGVQILLLVIILVLVNQTVVLKNKGVGLLKTIPIAAVFLIISILRGVMVSVAIAADNTLSFPFADVVIFTISMLLVGIAEELSYRGLMGVAFLKKFGTNQKGIWLAVICSSVFFGLSHFTNLIAGEDFAYTLTQVIATIFAGILFSAIFFRSGNFWACALLHAFNDFVVLFPMILVDSTSATLDGIGAASATGFDFGTIIFAAVTQLLPAIYLLRKSKLKQVRKNMGPFLETE